MSNYFKKLFENYEEQPAPEMWDKVMSDVKRYNSVVRARKIGAAAAIVVAGGVAAFFLLHGSNQPALTETNVVVAQETTVQNNIATASETVAVDAGTQSVDNKQAAANVVAPVGNNASKAEPQKNILENTIAPTAKDNESTVATNEKHTAASSSSDNGNTASTGITSNTMSTVTTVAPTAVAVPSETAPAEPANPSAIVLRSGSNPDTTTVTTDKPVKVQIPTAITPDKSENNFFSVTFDHPQLVKSYELSIFTRNGLMVFHSKDMNQGWDGKYKGRIQNMGAYAYVLIYTTVNSQRQVEKGTVTIVR